MLHILFWFTQAEVHAIQLLSASGYVTKS